LIISGTGENHITVTVGSSTGNTTIDVSANCAEGTCSLTSDSKTVTVGSVSTVIEEDDDDIPSGGGGAGGAGGTGGAGGIGGAAERPELLTTYEDFEVVRGESTRYPFEVKNIFKDSTLEDVTIVMSGYLAQYITYSPSKISNIDFNEINIFYLKVNAPKYMDRGEYPVNVTIKGKIKFTDSALVKNMLEQRHVTLTVHEVSRETMEDALEESMNSVEYFREKDFPCTGIEELLEQMKTARKEGRYGDAVRLNEQIETTRKSAFDANEIIEDIQNKIAYAEARMTPLPESTKLMNLAIAAFEREDFETALARAKEARTSVVLEAGARYNVVWFLMDNWWKLIAVAIIGFIISFLSYKRLFMIWIVKKLENLNKEEMSIIDLMQDAQKKFFDKKELSKDAYYTAMSHYQKRITKIKRERIKLRSRRVVLIKLPQEIKNLEKESSEVLELMKQAQKDYFILQKLPKGVYEDKIEAYTTHLADIEEQRIVLETKQERKRIIKSKKDTMKKGTGRKPKEQIHIPIRSILKKICAVTEGLAKKKETASRTLGAMRSMSKEQVKKASLPERMPMKREKKPERKKRAHVSEFLKKRKEMREEKKAAKIREKVKKKEIPRKPAKQIRGQIKKLFKRKEKPKRELPEEPKKKIREPIKKLLKRAEKTERKKRTSISEHLKNRRKKKEEKKAAKMRKRIMKKRVEGRLHKWKK